MKVITRFAPSPTGFLHVGNVRTALIAWMFARKHNGKFMLRIDDTDLLRSRQEYVDAIKEDLTWLGLHWDQEAVQSERLAKYEQIKSELIKTGALYPCYETAEELQVKKKLQLGQNKPPIYDRAALKLTPEQRQKMESDGLPTHYRLKLNEGKISWHDLIRGEISFDAKNISDPILIRADGTMTYSIASVVDDAEFGITHIIRGEDHITNSAMHIRLFEAMGSSIPEFAHLSLLKSQEGEISKRYGGFEIRALREAGFDRMAVLSLLAKMGTSDSIENTNSLQELVDNFSLAKLSKSTVTYDLDELIRLNAQLLHNKPYEEVEATLHAMGMVKADKIFWETVRANLSNINEVKTWYDICCAELIPITDDLEFTTMAASLLPKGEFTNETWDQWITAVKAATDKSGKAIFMPIRKALTNLDHGPELRYVLKIMGYDRAFKRLTGISA